MKYYQKKWKCIQFQFLKYVDKCVDIEYVLCHFNLENVQESTLSDCSKLIF